jgi:hypothetical protein
MFGAWREVQKLARDYGVIGNTRAMLLLIQTFVLPHAMYGCQVWGTAFLKPPDPTRQDRIAPLQKVMNAFYKQVVGARRSVPSITLLHELCQKPLQFYWLRALCRFWNNITGSDNSLLRKVAMRDTRVAGSSSWSAQLNQALQLYGGGRITHALEPIDTGTVCQSFWQQWERQWDCGDDPRDPQCAHRQICSYKTWFKQGSGTSIHHLPAHLKDGCGTDVARSMTRFRLGCTDLRVNTGRHAGMSWQERICMRCSDSHLIDDAWHFAFQCDTTAALRTDDRFADAFAYSNSDLRNLCDRKNIPLFMHLALKLTGDAADEA